MQQIETSYAKAEETKVVVTTAADVNEVQTITTYANRAETISGSFTVVFDTSDDGGSVETSAPISYDADAAGSNRTSMEEILEAMLNIGDVEVNRVESSVDEGVNGAYEWSITFLSDENKGNIPQLRLGQSNLVATGVGVAFDTTVQGNEISGGKLARPATTRVVGCGSPCLLPVLEYSYRSTVATCCDIVLLTTTFCFHGIAIDFTLSFSDFTTASLPYDATSAEVTEALVALDSISSVDVFRSGPDINRGYSWTITFTGP